jgi:protein-L-isoaspartate O-methyltransferase
VHWKPHAAALADGATHGASRWRPLVAALPRHEFVPRWWQRADDGWQLHDGPADQEQWAAAAYADRSLITRVGPLHADLAEPGERPHGAPTSSATLPSLVVRMFQHARIADGDQLLDVGTGSGYGTALATLRLGDEKVTSVDIDDYLVNAARYRLDQLGLRPQIATVDATGPLPGVYDRIVATVGVRPVPSSWLQALKPGGRLVTTISGTTLIVTAEKQDDGSAVGQVEWDRAGFMQARAGDDYADTLPPGLLEQARHGEGESVSDGDYPLLDIQEAWDVAAMLDIEAPGTVYGYDVDGQLRTTWLAHPDGSWARAMSLSGPRGVLPLVHQSGPQRLWDVLDRIRSYWLEHGELPLRGARVWITPEGQTRLARGSWRAAL